MYRNNFDEGETDNIKAMTKLAGNYEKLNKKRDVFKPFKSP